MRHAAALLFVAVALSATADDYPLDRRVDVQAYRFELELGDSDDVLHGVATLRIGLGDAGIDGVALDLVGATSGGSAGMTVSAVTVDGVPVPFTHAGDRLAIEMPAGAARDGEAVVTVQYSGVPADGLVIGLTRHGRRAFFGDSYPDRARHWLPTVDHVSDKALVEFVVTAPDHYQVIANGALREETDLGDGRRRTRWASDVPLPTKVMVIGVAEFAVQRLQPLRDIPVESWVYPEDREAGFHDFALARPILDFFDRTVGPYAYEKLANVQSKTRYGGMENAGNIFYSENAVRGDRSNEGLIAHEIAHQWFGDSVSEADWHHVWLSEGFATYFAQLYMEHAYGRRKLVDGMLAARRRVLAYSASGPGYAVVDERFGMRGLLSANSYQKGAWVLHMLRRRLGDDTFRAGIRAYYARHRHGNALTEDFRDAMEAVAGIDLDEFFAQWVYSPGQPRLALSWTWAEGRLLLVVRQLQDTPFDFDLDVGLRAEDGSVHVHTVRVDTREAVFDLEAVVRPAAVVADPETWLLFEEAGPAGSL